MLSEKACYEWACFCNETCIPYICNLSLSCPLISNPYDPCITLQCVDQLCLPFRNNTDAFCQKETDHGLAVLTTLLLIGIVIAFAFFVVFFITSNKKRLF